MAQFVGDSNGKARQIYNMYVGDANGKARKIKKAYVGDANGKARLFYENAVRQNSSSAYGVYINGGQCSDGSGEVTYCYPYGQGNDTAELTADVVYTFKLDPMVYYAKPERFSYYAPDGNGGMGWVYKEAIDDGSNITYKGALPFGTTMFGFANSGTVSTDTVDVSIFVDSDAFIYEYSGAIDRDGVSWNTVGNWIADITAYEGTTVTLTVGVAYVIMCAEGNYPNNFAITYSDGEVDWTNDIYDMGKNSAAYFVCESTMTNIDFFNK